MPKVNTKLTTYTGHPLTPREDKFISEYIETSNASQSAINAGYKSRTPAQQANALLKKDYIANEIAYRMQEIRKSSIMTAEEVLEYFSSVARGEITDQFGLEASLAERTKAAQELAKRLIDIPNKLESNKTPEIKITLDWASSESAESGMKLVKDIVATPTENADEMGNLDLT